MRTSSVLLISLSIGLLTTGCEVLPEPIPVPSSAFGMEPIYVDSIDGFKITTTGPDSILDGRSFAALRDTIFIVDNLRGVHVIDNSTPADPRKVSFIDIPGCTSVAINGNFLYVNNLTDLVTLDIRDPLNAIEVDREQDLYPRPLDFPEGYSGYFVCYDPSLGFLTGWQEQLIFSPQCFIE